MIYFSISEQEAQMRRSGPDFFSVQTKKSPMRKEEYYPALVPAFNRSSKKAF